MEADDPQRVAVALELDTETVPQPSPGQDMTVEYLVEPAEACEPPRRLVGRFRHCGIAAREQGDHLLRSDGLPGSEVDRDVVPDPAVPFDQPVRGGGLLVITPEGRPGGDCHGNAGIAGAHGDQHRPGGQFGGLHRLEVPAPERAVPLDQSVLDSAVDLRADVQTPRPVLGRDRRLQRADVRQMHGYESALNQRGDAAGGIA